MRQDQLRAQRSVGLVLKNSHGECGAARQPEKGREWNIESFYHILSLLTRGGHTAWIAINL